MALFSFASSCLTLWLLPGSSLSPNSPVLAAGQALFLSVCAAGLAAIAEGLSPRGTDPLSVLMLTSARLCFILYLRQAADHFSSMILVLSGVVASDPAAARMMHT